MPARQPRGTCQNGTLLPGLEEDPQKHGQGIRQGGGFQRQAGWLTREGKTRRGEEEMTIRAVYFDLGGVIVRTEFQAPRQRLAERFDREYDDLVKLIFDSETALQATLGL